MTEAPKKIWANAVEIEGWENKPDFGEPFQYIRADLVDGLVEVLQELCDLGIGTARIDKARAALKALEEE